MSRTTEQQPQPVNDQQPRRSRRAAPPENRRGPGRRAVILGAAAAALGGAGYLLHEDAERWWWRLPGNQRDREPGAVDHPGAEWVPASEENLNRADRPYDWEIDRVVIHVVQGSYAVALKVFQDPEHGAASHYVVRAEDGHVAQMIRELDVGHHAGNRDYNLRSIGIEHEGFVDRPEGFTDVMYRSSARLTAGICARYGIPVDRDHIIAHHEVPGADHTDPGPHWDWDRYLRLVRRASSKGRPQSAG